MRNIYLKESILVKDNGGEALTFDIKKDEFFQFKGDVAKLLVLLFDKYSKKENAVSPETLEKKLSQISKTFAANRRKKAALLEALGYLKENGLVDEEAQI